MAGCGPEDGIGAGGQLSVEKWMMWPMGEVCPEQVAGWEAGKEGGKVRKLPEMMR